MRRLAPLVLLAFAAACDDGGPIPGTSPSLRIVAGADDVVLGKAFPLTVVRVWEKSARAGEWKDDVVAPLAVQPVGTTRREDASRVEETRRFKAYAFVPGDLVVPAAGGGDAVKLHVRPSLDPRSPGTPELPGDPLPEPFPWTIATLGAVALLIASALLVARIRRRRPMPAPASAPVIAPPPAHLGALRRLDELARTPRSFDEIEAFHVAAASIVRDYLAERFGVRVATETSEELGAASLLPLTPAHRALLASFLARCDLVKFARQAPGSADRGGLVASAMAFVTETASS